MQMSKGYNSQQTTRGMSVISNINDDATGNGNVVEDSSFKMDVGRTAQVGRQQGHLRQDGGRQGQGGGDGGGGTARCPPRKVTFVNCLALKRAKLLRKTSSQHI